MLTADTDPTIDRVCDECGPYTFAFTIHDMGDFAAGTYAASLDAWCRATLTAWSG